MRGMTDRGAVVNTGCVVLKSGRAAYKGRTARLVHQ